MQVDYGLILCAGKGTRMGPVGEVLPKPLWPIFEKTLLELQVARLKKMGAQKIFVNVHHLAQKMKDFVRHRYSEEVSVLEEDELLDVGGGIHNLAHKVNYKGSLLVTVSDHFHKCSSPEKIEQIQADVVLFAIAVEKGHGYNQLSVGKDHAFLGVIKNKDIVSKDHFTFMGTSLINLESLNRSKGVLNYFQAVANPQERKVKVYPVEDLYDFGSIDDYFKGLFHLNQDKNLRSHFEQWDQDFIRPNKIKDQSSYGEGQGPQCLNLTPYQQEGAPQSILLGEAKSFEFKGPGVYFEQSYSATRPLENLTQ